MDVYNYKVAVLNVNQCNLEFLRIGEEIYRKLIGGKGLGAYLLYKHLKPKTGPFDASAPIILAAGPLNNSRYPLTSKVGFFFKSPMTGGYGESYVGGSLPKYPKAIGYDAIVIIGKAKEPTTIVFSGDGINFVDAKDLWGLGIVDTTRELKKYYGKRATVVAIGPAAENLVRFSCIGIDNWRQAGRSGGGAVLGAKKIKALVFIGGEDYYEPKDKDAFDTVFHEVLDRIKNYRGKDYFRNFGTSAMSDMANEMGFFPSYYWSKGNVENPERLSSHAVRELLKHPHPCWNCPFACGRLISFEWEGREIEMDGLEYETLYALGGLIGVENIRAVAYLNYLADDLGLDVISLGNIIGFTIEAAKRGKIHLNIDYGNMDSIVHLIKMIAYKEGIGALLAEGVARVADALELDDIAIHVKGLEPAGYDPRVLKTMSLAYATSPRGACHLRAMGYIIDIRKLAGPPSVLDEKKVYKMAEFEEWMVAFDSLIICKFARDIYDFEFLVKMFNAATGWDLSVGEFRDSMRRIVLLTRLVNEREGFSKHDDFLPKRFFSETLVARNKEAHLTEKEFAKALELYYEIRGIDKKSGLIKPETLEKFGLKSILEGTNIG